MHTLSLTAPLAPQAADQVVSRGGLVARLRLAFPDDDHDELARFFHGLPLDSLRRRVFGPAEPSATRWAPSACPYTPDQASTMLALGRSTACRA